MAKNCCWYTKNLVQKIHIFLTRIVAGFHSKTWKIQSVLQNLDSEKVTFYYPLLSSKFQIALRAAKDPLRVEWKPFASYCEGWLIRADIAICFLDLGGQYLYLAWSTIKYLIMHMMYTATKSRGGITKFFRRTFFKCRAAIHKEVQFQDETIGSTFLEKPETLHVWLYNSGICAFFCRGKG